MEMPPIPFAAAKADEWLGHAAGRGEGNDLLD